MFSIEKDQSFLRENSGLCNSANGNAHCLVKGRVLWYSYVNGCASCINAFRGDIHAIPSQAEQFAQTQGAGEREIDAQPQLRIITNFQSTEQRFGCPNITFLGSVLGQGSVNAGILFHEFPFYSLLKGAPQNLMNRTDCTGGNKLVQSVR